MTSLCSSRVVPMVALLLLATTAVKAEAQACRATPRGGGIAFVKGDVYLGSTYGVAASKGAVAVGFNSLNSDTDVRAWDANIRFTLAMGARFQFCPSLGLEYMNQSYAVSDGSELTGRQATAAAGIAFRYEQEVSRGISVAPFIGIDYHFTGVVFSLNTPDASEDELSGDTLSFVNLQYGGVVQYKSFYAGFAADRSLDSERKGLYRTRLLLGLAFGGGNRSSRAAPVPRSSIVRASSRR